MSLLLSTFSLVGITLFIYMSVLFVVALIRTRNDSVDIGWGLGFVLVALVSLLLYTPTPRMWLVFVLVALWGLRLAFHIWLRSRGKAEDWRYKKWRDEWGKWFVLRSYLQVFLLQGLLLFLVALPIQFVATFDTGMSLGWLDLIGVAAWLFGFCFEVIGDYQLSVFLKNPENKGTIMTQGLWKYTRHPNYFGEIKMWWGIWLIALSVPYGWISIIGPLTITILITKVSGIPLLEKRYEGNEAYEAYKKVTPKLVPWVGRR